MSHQWTSGEVRCVMLRSIYWIHHHAYYRTPFSNLDGVVRQLMVPLVTLSPLILGQHWADSRPIPAKPSQYRPSNGAIPHRLARKRLTAARLRPKISIETVFTLYQALTEHTFFACMVYNCLSAKDTYIPQWLGNGAQSIIL